MSVINWLIAFVVLGACIIVGGFILWGMIDVIIGANRD